MNLKYMFKQTLLLQTVFKAFNVLILKISQNHICFLYILLSLQAIAQLGFLDL